MTRKMMITVIQEPVEPGVAPQIGFGHRKIVCP